MYIRMEAVPRSLQYNWNVIKERPFDFEGGGGDFGNK